MLGTPFGRWCAMASSWRARGVLPVLPQNPSRDTRRRMETKLAKRRMLAATQGTRDEWAMSETGGGDEKCRTWAGPGTLCPTPTDGAGFQNKPEKQEMLTTPGQQPFPKEPASQRRSVAPSSVALSQEDDPPWQRGTCPSRQGTLASFDARTRPAVKKTSSYGVPRYYLVPDHGCSERCLFSVACSAGRHLATGKAWESLGNQKPPLDGDSGP